MAYFHFISLLKALLVIARLQKPSALTRNQWRWVGFVAVELVIAEHQLRQKKYIMKKKLNVIIDGKEHSIEYERTGNRFDVIAEDKEIQRFIPSSFFIKDNHVEFLSVSDRSQEIMNIIVKQINQHEK